MAERELEKGSKGESGRSSEACRWRLCQFDFEQAVNVDKYGFIYKKKEKKMFLS